MPVGVARASPAMGNPWIFFEMPLGDPDVFAIFDLEIILDLERSGKESREFP